MIKAKAQINSPGLLMHAVRAPFLTATVVPTLVGAAIAWAHGILLPGYLLLTLVALTASQGGVNVLNDYFDYLSGNDNRYPKPGPFSGGTRLIQEGILTPGQTLAISLSCFALALVTLIFLGVTRGWGAWWLGAAGLFLAVFYSAPPFRLSYVGHGLGELAVGLGFGPIMVLGSYYVQALHMDSGALVASIPVGLLIAAVVLINGFPDYRADKEANKNTLVVALGPEQAVGVYQAMVLGSFVILVTGIAFGVLPLTCGIAFLALPIAWQSVKGAKRFYGDAEKLIPSNAGTIKLHLTFGILLALGYVLMALLGPLG